jgi:hypothetical protein
MINSINIPIYCRSKGSITFQTVFKHFSESRNIAPTNASNTSAKAFGAVESAH